MNTLAGLRNLTVSAISSFLLIGCAAYYGLHGEKMFDIMGVEMTGHAAANFMC